MTDNDGRIVFTERLCRRREGSRVVVSTVPLPQRAPSRRPAKVALVLATAHRWQREIDSGEVADQGSIARREGITAARVSQVMTLLSLAPALQELVLFLDAVDGVEPLVERELREAAKTVEWAEQRDRLALPGLVAR